MSDYKRIIDVSAWQANIDWNSVDVDGVILRAGVSVRKNGALSCNIDKYFQKNYDGAKSKGIPVGVYYYSHALNTNDAVAEAEYVLRLLSGKQFEYPIYYDVEEQEQFRLGKKAVSNIIRAFLSKVESAGYWVGLYCSRSPLTTHVDEDIRTRYAIWIAEYGVDKPKYDGAYGMWQSGIGKTKGVAGDVDIDRGYIDYPAEIKSRGLNGFKAEHDTSTSKDNIEKAVADGVKELFVNPYRIPSVLIKRGSKGDGVKWVQQNLTQLGYDIGKYGIDGDFGKATDCALKKFQKDYGLGVDGICGQQTRAMMLKLTSRNDTKAVGFTPRLTRPEAGNKYYITKGNGGWSPAIKGSPTDKMNDVLSNCVGFALGRFNEIAGDESMSLLASVNAENFYDIALQQGLTVSDTPSLGAVMCWQKGATRSYTDGAGHIAVVEQIVSADEVVTSESGYGCANPFWVQNRKRGSGNWGAGSNYKFLGFIKNPAIKE